MSISNRLPVPFAAPVLSGALPYSAGVALCLLATVSWGGMFPVMDGALSRIDPFTFTSIRYTLAACAFLALLLGTEGRKALDLRGERVALAWIVGSAGFCGFGFLVFLGQQIAGREGALTASIIMATQPMLGLLVTWAVRRVAPPIFSFAFIAMSFTGVILVVTKGDVTGLVNAPQSYGADLLIVLGALCWVIYTVGASFFPKWSPVKYTAMTTALGLSSVLTVNMALYALDVVPMPSGQALQSVTPHLAYMALVAGFVGVLSWNLGNRIVTPANGVLFMDVVPLTTFIVAAARGDIPTAWQITGACLTAAALVGNNLYVRFRARASEAARQATATSLGESSACSGTARSACASRGC